MEDLYLEYKEEFPKEKNDKKYETLIRESVTFLNASGGILKVGVKDSGDIVGITYNFKHIEKIMESVIGNISPSIRTNIDYTIKTKEGFKILEIVVNEGSRKPYYISKYGKSTSGVYYRSGTSARSLTHEEIIDLENKKFTTSYDLKSPIQELTFNELCSRTNMELEEVVNQFELLKDEIGFNYSAFLLSDQNYRDIDIFIFSGSNRSRVDSSKVINKSPLFAQFDTVMNYFNSINHNVIVEMKSVRKEEALYDIEIIRECIINALVHNDYSQADTIKIHIFDDRLEISNRVEAKHITSPYFLMNSKVVNASLFRCFKKLNIIEGQGIGYAKIINKYGINSFKIDKTDCSISVIIPKYNGKVKTTFSVEEIILGEIAKGNDTSSKILRNITFGKTKLSKVLNTMIEDNIIQRVGNGKSTHYTIKHKK